jgi:uncharacterized protein DUF5658
MNNALLLFVLLQVADVTTTLVAFHFGGVEENPLVQFFLRGHPVAGLLLTKFLLVTIAGVIVLTGRKSVVWKANVLFACIVAWNVSIVARLIVA